ncbi:MAG: hypothetical protein PVI52_04940, partial [Chromatiales bacterium]
MDKEHTIPPIVVNFSRFTLEGHVQRAISLAWKFSGGHPIDASHLLKGALVIADEGKATKAFSKLRELLPIPDVVEPAETNLPPADLAALPLVGPLAQAFTIAESFFTKEQTVWGRDYITLALLAKDDPSLAVLARNAGTDIESVRNEWHKLLDIDTHRQPEDWDDWWRSAGIPLSRENNRVPETPAA